MIVFNIEKGVPLPKDYGLKDRLPLTDMEPGDSFFVPIMDEQAGRVRNRIAQHAYRSKGMKFTLRSVTEDGVEGIRVWRTG